MRRKPTITVEEAVYKGSLDERATVRWRPTKSRSAKR
jgi:hypothetical protein